MTHVIPEISLKTELEDLTIEYDCSPILLDEISEKRQLIEEGISEIDKDISAIQGKIDELNKEIDRLTYNGDTFDLLLAVGCGMISGAIDIIFVGELGLFKNAGENAKDKFENDIANTHEKFNRFIINYAQNKGYKGDRLPEAINYIEKKYPVAQDNIWKGRKISSSKTHHLDDLAHHPSMLGLISAIFVQLLGISLFSGKSGEVSIVPVKITKKNLVNICSAAVITGLIYWLVIMAEKKVTKFDESLPKPIITLIKNLHKAPLALLVLKTSLNWTGHLISDLGGSKSTAGGGEGIPGLFLSFFKELSMLPGFNSSSLPKVLNDLYLHTSYSPLTHKLDLRTEIPVIKEQALPVTINEVTVRTIYFIWHLIVESEKKEIGEIEWSRVVPFYNRTIVRMMTVATGTFTAVDLIDAAVETAAKHPEACSNLATFLGAMVMRVNFVGIGRFAIAVSTDISMGIKKTRAENEQSELIQNIIVLTETKLFYKQADSQLELANAYNTEAQMYKAEETMWIQIGKTQESFDKLYSMVTFVGNYYANSIANINEQFKLIEKDVEELKEKDPKFIDGLLERLS